MAPECCASTLPSPDFGFSPDEFAVCEILLQLPVLIEKSKSFFGLLPAWGRKRKRSALNYSTLPSGALSLSSPPSSLPHTAAVPSSTPAETEEPPSKEVKELSPTTPLSLNSLTFSPSESDENTKRSKKKVSLKTKTEWLEAIDELTKRKQVLEGEMEVVKRRYDHLKSINSELKAKKQKTILGLKNESAQPERGNSSSAMEIARLTVKSPTLQNHHHPQPSIKNQTAPTPEQSQNFQIAIGKMPSYEHLGPIGIPDLNISLEELTQKNYSKIMAAQARQRRIQICKTKNSNAATRLQSPPNPCR